MNKIFELIKVFWPRKRSRKNLSKEELEEEIRKDFGVQTEEELNRKLNKSWLKNLRKVMDMAKDFPFNKVSKVWIFATVVYSDEILVEIRDSIINNTFENKEEYKKDFSFMKDLLHFYLLELKDGKQYAIAYVDPFDYVNDELLWYYEPAYKVELPPDHLIYEFD